jgi:uridine monophosphate synthetase
VDTTHSDSDYGEKQYYFPESVKMAESNKDFVIGFICTQKLSSEPSFVHMTPGKQ